MAGFTATAWIAASPETIFAFIGNVKYFPEAIPNVQSAKQLTASPVGLGTRFSETRLMNGREATSELEVTTYEPPHRYAAATTQSGITVTYHYSFTPENDGTRVDLNAEFSASGLRKLMVPVVIGVIKKEDGDHLEHLKRAIEKRESVPTA